MECRRCHKKLEESAWTFCPYCGESTSSPTQPGRYGSGVRAQVFEVIVRQALAGAPWREICAGPMQINSISPEEIELEVQRRRPSGVGSETKPLNSKIMVFAAVIIFLIIVLLAMHSLSQ